MTNAVDLLPCPFCGGTSFTYRAAQIGDSYYCETCGAYGPLADADTIRDKWNTRIEDLERAVSYEADLAQMALDARKELEAAFTNISREYDKRGDRIEELEAKLAKVVEALEGVRVFATDLEPYADQGHTLVPALHKACTTLAEIKGESHDVN